MKKSSPKNLSADCRSTVGRQVTDSLPTGFLGSSSSQLPETLVIRSWVTKSIPILEALLWQYNYNHYIQWLYPGNKLYIMGSFPTPYFYFSQWKKVYISCDLISGKNHNSVLWLSLIFCEFSNLSIGKQADWPLVFKEAGYK